MKKRLNEAQIKTANDAAQSIRTAIFMLQQSEISNGQVMFGSPIGSGWKAVIALESMIKGAHNEKASK